MEHMEQREVNGAIVSDRRRHWLPVILLILPYHAALFAQGAKSALSRGLDFVRGLPCDTEPMRWKVPPRQLLDGLKFSLAMPASRPEAGDREMGYSPLEIGNSELPPRPENTFAVWSSQWPRPHGETLLAQQEVNSQVGKQQATTKSSPSTRNRSPGHIFWVIPAFKVDYGKGFQPLSRKEKFDEWAKAEYDPLGLAAGAVEAATLEHSSADGFCGYGHGWGGYGECFGSLQLDATDSSFIGDFLLPVLMHQDPRYFRLGEGSVGRRVGYAISRVFVTYNDSGHTVFFTSALSGTVIAAGLSNLYYPAQDVNASHTVSRIAIDLGNTALYNLAAEFWPDIHSKLHHIF